MQATKALKGAALAAVVLASGLAGCLAAPAGPTPTATIPPALEPLTEPLFGFGEFVAMKVPSVDGAEIHVDVQLPDGEGPWPVLVEYTPYSLLGPNAWGAANESGLDGLVGFRTAAYYVPRGYAVGVAHVRGTGESGGCLTVGGPVEGQDGYAVVEALAAQPWSTGKVALLGTSYVGSTPLQTAVLNPPHLATVVSISSVTEWYRYYFEHGITRVNGDPPPGSSITDPVFYAALGWTPGVRTAAADPEDVACVAEFTRQYWLQDDYNAFWKERNTRAMAANVTAPVLYAQGFLDENVATTMIPEFWPNVTAEKRAWFAQHAHGVPQAREGWWQYVHRWLDHFLLGKANGALDLAPVLVEDNRGRWRAEAAWPPADARPLRLWLAADGTLAPEAPAEGARSYRDDGTGSEDAALEGVNHLRWVSAPLDAPLHVAGEPRVLLHASSSLPDTQWDVLVYDRDPQGVDHFLTRGYLDARHRESLEQGRDLTPGEAYPFGWPLHPRDHVVEEGHQVVVVVKSSDPYVVREKLRGAENTVHSGPEGSWIEFPSIPMAARAYQDQEPLPWPEA